MLNSHEIIERLSTLAAYRMDLVRKLSSSYHRPEEYTAIKDTLMQVDAVRKDLIAYFELLQKPINY